MTASSPRDTAPESALGNLRCSSPASAGRFMHNIPRPLAMLPEIMRPVGGRSRSLAGHAERLCASLRVGRL